MDEEIVQNKCVLDQYLAELQKSSFIKNNTNRNDHNIHVRRLMKL